MAGWIIASLAVLAVCGAGWRLGQVRRRRRLNGLVHELRRPAQTIALLADRARCDGLGLTSAVDQLALGLDQLDAQLNGRGAGVGRAPRTVSELVRDAERRWGWSGRVRTRIDPDVGDRRLDAAAEPAVDNLIANALEHARGTVTIRAGVSPGGLQLTVSDGGAVPEAESCGRSAADPGHRGAGGEPHRGHGRRAIARAARSAGGEVVVDDAGIARGVRLPAGGASP